MSAMFPPSSSLLSLPDSALYSILDLLIPGGIHSRAHMHGIDSDAYFERRIPLDIHARDGYTLFGDLLEWGNVITFDSYSPEFHHLSTSCTRLNQLYRARVRRVKLSRAYPLSACARIWARFPSIDGLSFYLGPRPVIGRPRSDEKVVADADNDAKFLCKVLPAHRALRSLSIGRGALRVPTLRRVIRACERLETLSLWDFKLVHTVKDGAPVCADSSDATQTLSFGAHGKNLKSLWLAGVDNVSLPLFSGPPFYSSFHSIPIDSRCLSLTRLGVLENLSLPNIDLSDDDFSAIAALPRLLRLDLGVTNLDHSSFATIYPALSRLRHLDIGNCSKLDEPLRLPLPPQLELLDISSNRSNMSLFAIPASGYAPVASPHCLKMVRAAGCVLRSVALLLHHATGIRELDLSKSSFEDWADLAELLQRATELKKLVLYRLQPCVNHMFRRDKIHISNSVFIVISRLARLKQLRLTGAILSIDNNSSLMSGPCRKSLRKLCLKKCLFVSETSEDRKAIIRACHRIVVDSFVNCAVEWDRFPF